MPEGRGWQCPESLPSNSLDTLFRRGPAEEVRRDARRPQARPPVQWRDAELWTRRAFAYCKRKLGQERDMTAATNTDSIAVPLLSFSAFLWSRCAAERASAEILGKGRPK